MIQTAVVAVFCCSSVSAAAKPLKVYILAGQSNMQGHAAIKTLPHMVEDPKTKPLYDKFVDTDGKPRIYDQVRLAAFSEMDAWGNPKPEQTFRKGPLAIGFGSHLKDPNKFGPELGFGVTMHDQLSQPILIIKTAWGGKSLMKDYRPPNAAKLDSVLDEEGRANARQREEAWLAQYGETYVKKFKLRGMDELRELRRTAPGRYYRLMLKHVKDVLADPGKFHPAYDKEAGYEIGGFVWFQGFNDLVSGNNYKVWGGHAVYGQWLACLIRDLRKELSAANMPVVIGVMGVGGKIENVSERQRERMAVFRRAMAAPASLPEFKGRVAAVQTAPFWPTDVARVDAKRNQIKKQVEQEARAKQKSDPQTKKQELNKWQRERLEVLLKESLTEGEQHLLKIGKCNWSLHYFGNAKCIGQMGEAFAKALLEMQ